MNRLNKTKNERVVDHEQERIDRLKKENTERRAAAAKKVRFLEVAPLSEIASYRLPSA